MNMDELIQAQKELRSDVNLLKEQTEEVLKTFKALVEAKQLRPPLQTHKGLLLTQQ